MMIPTHELGADYTGSGYRHYQSGEHIILGNEDATRIFMPENGSFYLDSLIIKDVNTNRVMSIGVDYLVFGFDKVAAEKSGRDVRGIIHITNTEVSQVSLEYQFVGGLHRSGYHLLNSAILNDIKIGRKLVDWFDIMEKPEKFDVAYHRHHINDTIKVEGLIIVLNRIRDALAIYKSRDGAFRNIYSQLQDMFNQLADRIERIKEDKKRDAEAKLNTLRQAEGEYIHTDNPDDPSTYKGYGNWARVDGFVLTPVSNTGRSFMNDLFLPKGGSSTPVRNTYIYRRIPERTDNLQRVTYRVSGGNTYSPGSNISISFEANFIGNITYTFYDESGKDVTSRFDTDSARITVSSLVSTGIVFRIPNNQRYVPGKYSFQLNDVQSIPFYFELVETSTAFDYIAEPVKVSFVDGNVGDAVYEYNLQKPLWVKIEVNDVVNTTLKKISVNNQSMPIPTNHVVSEVQYFDISSLAKVDRSRLVDCKVYDNREQVIGWGSVSKVIDLQPYDVVCKVHGTNEIVETLEEGKRYQFFLKSETTRTNYSTAVEFINSGRDDFTFNSSLTNSIIVTEREHMFLDITVLDNFKNDPVTKALVIQVSIGDDLTNNESILNNSRSFAFPIKDTSQAPIFNVRLSKDISGIEEVTEINVGDPGTVFMNVTTHNWKAGIDNIGLAFKPVNGGDFNLPVSGSSAVRIQGKNYPQWGLNASKTTIPLNIEAINVLGGLSDVDAELIFKNQFTPLNKRIRLTPSLKVSQFYFRWRGSSGLSTTITEAWKGTTHASVLKGAELELGFYVSNLTILDREEPLFLEWSENAHVLLASNKADGELRDVIKIGNRADITKTDRETIPFYSAGSTWVVNEPLTVRLSSEAKGDNTVVVKLKNRGGVILGETSITIRDNHYNGTAYLELRDSDDRVIPTGEKLSRKKRYYLYVLTNNPNEKPKTVSFRDLNSPSTDTIRRITANAYIGDWTGLHISEAMYHAGGEYTANFELTIQDSRSDSSATNDVVTQTLTKELTFLDDNKYLNASPDVYNRTTGHSTIHTVIGNVGDVYFAVNNLRMSWNMVCVVKVEYDPSIIPFKLDGFPDDFLNKHFAIYATRNEHQSGTFKRWNVSINDIRKLLPTQRGKFIVSIYNYDDVNGVNVVSGKSDLLVPVTIKDGRTPLHVSEFNFSVETDVNSRIVSVSRLTMDTSPFYKPESREWSFRYHNAKETDTLELYTNKPDLLDITVANKVVESGGVRVTYRVTSKAQAEGLYALGRIYHRYMLAGIDSPETTRTIAVSNNNTYDYVLDYPNVTSRIVEVKAGSSSQIKQSILSLNMNEEETINFDVLFELPKVGLHRFEILLKGSGLKKIFNRDSELIHSGSVNRTSTSGRENKAPHTYSFSISSIKNELVNAEKHNEFMLVINLRDAEPRDHAGGNLPIIQTVEIPITINDTSKRPKFLVSALRSSTEQDNIVLSIMHQSNNARETSYEVYGTDSETLPTDKTPRFLIGRSTENLVWSGAFNQTREARVDYSGRRYTRRSIGKNYYFILVIKGKTRTDSEEFDIIDSYPFQYSVKQANSVDTEMTDTGRYWFTTEDGEALNELRLDSTSKTIWLYREVTMVSNEAGTFSAAQFISKYKQDIEQLATFRDSKLNEYIVKQGDFIAENIDIRPEDLGYRHTYHLKQKYIVRAIH